MFSSFLLLCSVAQVTKPACNFYLRKTKLLSKYEVLQRAICCISCVSGTHNFGSIQKFPGNALPLKESGSVTITSPRKLISGQMNQLCVNILAKAIWYKEFCKPVASMPSEQTALVKVIKK